MARTIRLNFDVDSRGIATANRGLRGLSGSMGRVANSARGIKKYFGGFNVASIAAAAGIGSFTAALTAVISKTATWGDTLAKTADSANISIEALQAMRYAGERAGISIEQTDQAVLAFNKRLGRAAEGSGLAAAGYRSLGISARDLVSATENGDGALTTVIEAIAAIEEPARRSAVATQLLGDTYGRKILPLLAKGTEGVREVVREGRRLGFIFTEEEIRRTEGYADAWLNLTTVGGNLARKLGLELMPNITAFMERLVADDDLVPNLYRALEDAAAGAMSFARGAKAAVKGLDPLIKDIKRVISLAKTAQKGLEGVFSQFTSMKEKGVLQHFKEGFFNDVERLKDKFGFGSGEPAGVDGTTSGARPGESLNKRARTPVELPPITVYGSRTPVPPSTNDGGDGGTPELPMQNRANTRALEQYKAMLEDRKAYLSDFVMFTRQLNANSLEDEQLRIQANLRIRLDALEQEKQAVKERFGLTEAMSQAFAERVTAIHAEAAEAQKRLADNVAASVEEPMSLLGKVGQTAIGRLGSAFDGFFTGQKQNMKEFASSFIADIGRMIAKAALLRAVSGMGGPAGDFLSKALGGTTAFANGGILTSPVQFPMGGGRGVAGEAGPEAILPLKRGRNGKLGVVGGVGGNSAVVNNNITFHASGNEQTDRSSIQQLRAAVDMAVKKQLAEQRYNMNRGY